MKMSRLKTVPFISYHVCSSEVWQSVNEWVHCLECHKAKMELFVRFNSYLKTQGKKIHFWAHFCFWLNSICECGTKFHFPCWLSGISHLLEATHTAHRLVSSIWLAKVLWIFLMLQIYSLLWSTVENTAFKGFSWLGQDHLDDFPNLKLI